MLTKKSKDHNHRQVPAISKRKLRSNSTCKVQICDETSPPQTPTPSFMATTATTTNSYCSSSSNLPWAWIIETLAASNYNQVDTSIIADLVSRVSNFASDEIFKNARERFSLRLLEQEYLSRCTSSSEAATDKINGVSSSNTSAISILSDHQVEDVLFHIINMERTANLGKLKQEISRFILQKRAGLPKCALQQMKDAILEGSQPLVALREKSQLFSENKDRSKIHVNGTDLNEATKKHDITSNGETHAQIENLVLLSHKNGNELLQEDPPSKHLESTQRDMPKDKEVACLDENKICLDGVGDDANKIPMQSLKDGEFQSLNTNAAPLGLENKNATLLEDPVDSALVSTKRKRSGLAEIAQMRCFDECRVDSCDHHLVSLTHEQCISNFGDIRATGQKLAPLHGNKLSQEVQPSRILLLDERETSCMVKETEVQGIEENMFCEDGHDYVALKRLKQSSNDDDIRYSWSHFPCKGDKISHEACPDGPHQQIDVNESKEISHDAGLDRPQQQIDTKEAKDNNEYPIVTETLSDSDENLKDKMVIAAEKRRLLNFQSTLNDDSLATSDSTEQSFCVKCNMGGQLLFCSATGCLIAVHESCLGSSASFDSTGNFFCPFCSYSKATTAYIEAKRKAALAKKCLSTFMSMVHEHHRMQPPQRIPGEEQSQSKTSGDEDLHDKICNNRSHSKIATNYSVQTQEHREEAEDAIEFVNIDGLSSGARTSLACEKNDNPTKGEHSKRVDDLQDRELVEDQQLPETSKCGDDDLPLRDLETAAICETPDVSLTKENIDNKEIIEKHESVRGEEEEMMQVEAGMTFDPANSPCRNMKLVSSQVAAQVVIGKAALLQQTVDPPQELSSHLTISTNEAAESENNDDASSTDSMIHRKSTNRLANSTFPYSRRKKIPWTAEEEEILKEGVHRFSNTDGTKPWKRILEFGCHVFQKSRTPIDLKDKWRNMWSKGGSKAR